MPEPRLRPYVPGDEAALLALHRRVFHHTPSLAEWRHKFLDNPAGPATILVIEQGGQIVGHWANLPGCLSLAGQELRAARGVDLMLAPEIRRGLGGSRLAVRLNQDGVELAGAAGDLDLHYSIPQPVPARLFLKYGGRTRVGPTPPVQCALNPAYVLRGKPRWAPVTALARPLGRALARLRALGLARAPSSGPALIALDRFDQRADDLWAAVAARYPLTLLRDARFLNWRFPAPDQTRLALGAPDRLEGWVVLSAWHDRGWRGGRLLDLVARDDLAAERLARAALAHFARRGLDVVSGWMMPHAPDWPALRRLGFRPRRPVIDLLVRPYLGGRLPLDYLRQPEHWHLTLADTDGV
jgi:hypothetical protein